MGYRMINGVAHRVLDIECNNINHKKREESKDTSFNQVLKNEIEKREYTISKHAEIRLKEINFNKQDMKKIEKGFKIAEDKGAKNSLMIYKDLALITSIENRTVITAVSKERAKDNIYTNIDSVVIL